MRLNRTRLAASGLRLLAVALALLVSSLTATGQVVTQHNDNARTGQNLSETILTTSNVNASTFGKLFARAVDGQMYAQPLYVPNLTIQGGMHNVVFVATMHNSVYAFDADNPAASTALWHVNLGTSVPSTDIDPAYSDITPEIGILSTPVIDTASATIYVVAKTKTASNPPYHFQLHALDLLTGAEKFTGPVEITASVSGSGDGSTSGQVSLDPLHHLNRPGLLLANGVVYLAFGGVGDIFPFHGWVLGYNSSTLQRVAVFNVTPNGSDGAVWQAGNGLACDAAGNIYFMTGNGTFDANTGGTGYGDSILKLGASSGLTVADYFTPFNQDALSAADTDLGSGGLMLIPGTPYAVGAGKDGVLRLIDTGNMGKFNASTNHDVQEFQVLSGGLPFMGGPIYWNSPNNGPVIYLWGPGDFLKAYKFTGSSFQTTPVSQSGFTEFGGYSDSVPLSLSSNGSQAGTGIIWASAAEAQDANEQTVPGTLRAFDATNLSVELWNSRQNLARDDVGNFAKFAPPTVANGRVYVATFSNQLAVYGLLGLSVNTTVLPNGVLGVAYSQTLTASGGRTPYTWSIIAGGLPAGLALDPATGKITGTPTAAGTSTFTVQVRDAASATATSNLGITISATAPTLAIDASVSADSSSSGTTFTTPALTTTSANELLVAFITASSPGTGTNTTVTGVTNTGGALAWTRAARANGQPGTAEIWWAYATTMLSGTVTATVSQTVSSGSITVLTFTGAGTGADAIGATGTGGAASGAPTASLVTTRANSWVFGAGNDWSSAASRTVGSSQTKVHEFLSTSTGDTYWVQSRSSATPTVGTTVTINDTAPTGDIYNLAVLEVRPPSSTSPPPLSITTTSLPNGTVGVAYNQALAASGGTTPYAWSATGLPGGLTISGGGVISGTPTSAGAFNVSVTVIDAASGTATKALGLTVAATQAPTLAIDASVSADSSSSGTAFTTPTLTTTSANELLVAFITASSPGTGTNTTVTGVTNTGGALAWTRAARANGQPGTAEIWWAYATTLLSGTVTATVSQTVSSGSITVLTFTGAGTGADAIGATGAGGAASGAPTASVVTTRANSWVFGAGNDWSSAASRTVGSSQTKVHEFLSSSTGDTYWVQSRSSATPTVGTTVTINDTAPTGDIYNLAVLEVRPPASTSPPPLSITTTSLPNGTVGVAYNQALAASGGTTPYAWSATGLPGGLTISGGGVISGTPTSAGAFSVSVTVTDAASGTATKALGLTVAATQAIAIDVPVSTDSATSGTTITSPALTTAGANELLVAFVGASAPTTGTNTTVTAVSNTGGALTWTRAVRTNGQRGTAEIWWAYATSAFSGTVTATLSQTVSSRSITVVSFTGTAVGSAAIGATGSRSASSGAPTASLVTTRANSWVFGVGNDRGRAVARTLGSGQTMVHVYLATATADTYWVQRRTSATPATGTTVTINDTAPTTDRYNLSIIEIRTP